MTFKLNALGMVVLSIAVLFTTACKYNNRHDGEVYCEVRPLYTASGWGYDIYVDKKLYIRQQFIPAVPGTQAFKSKEDAMKTGILVLHKLTHGKVPVVTVAELKDLKIIQ